MTLDEYFDGYEESRPLFDTVCGALDTIGPTKIRVSTSRIAFRRRQAVARVWIPARHLHRRAAPLVLTLGFRQRHPSPRWKEIVEPAPGRFTHHLELFAVADIDAEVRDWLRAAWRAAA